MDHDRRRTAPDPAAISASLARLIERAEGDVARELAMLADPRCAVAPARAVVLVLDGTSPLAGLAPPELRRAGASKYAARLFAADDLAARVARAYPALADALRQPAACGHARYLVTTKLGGAVQCTTCELGFTATPASGGGAGGLPS